MQRIMIVSDTHRRHGNLAEAIYNEGHLDMLIHLGDVEGEEEVIKSIAGCETIFIAGNNDFFSPLDREKEIELGGKKIWLTHGHNYYVSLDLKVIEQEAVARGMDIVMFGRSIHGISFVYAAAFTLVFTLLVNISMYGKLNNISMVESLKSVE